MGGPLRRAMHGAEGWRESCNLVSSIIVFHATKKLRLLKLNVRTVGLPRPRAAAVKGKLSHQGQYNSIVSLVAFVLDVSGRYFWMKKLLVTVPDSLYRNLNASPQNG